MKQQNTSATADPCTIEKIGYLLSPSYSGSSMAALAGLLGKPRLKIAQNLEVNFPLQDRRMI
jgi:hypothetical protein